MLSLKISYCGLNQMTVGLFPPPKKIYSLIYSSIKYVLSACYGLGAGCAMVHEMAMILELIERVLVENTGYNNVNTKDTVVNYVKEKHWMLPK